MRTVLNVVVRLLVVIVFSLALLFAIGLVHSTTHGYLTWWVWSRGSVTVGGVGNGYLHLNWKNSGVIITRTDLRPRQSYLIWMGEKNSLINCGEWHAPHVPAFPIVDVNPPCSIFSNGSDIPSADNPVPSTLTASSRLRRVSNHAGQEGRGFLVTAEAKSPFTCRSQRGDCTVA